MKKVNKIPAAKAEIVKARTRLARTLWQRFKSALPLVLALTLLAWGGLQHGQAAAESPPRLTSMAISVMPEYDQPQVLVSYRGEFNSDISLPRQVRLRLPADATIEHVCSLKPPTDEHLCQPYTAEPEGQYLALSYETITPIIYVEFYYGSVSGAGQRSLDFTFWPPYPVQSLDLFVLEPQGATDFTLVPAPADTVEEQGFRHHTYTYEDLSEDKPVKIEMSYSRQTDQPSVPLRAAAAAGADDNGGLPQGVILLLGLTGAAVLGFAFYSAFGRRFRIRVLPHSQQAPRDEGTPPPAGAFFCRHCGHRVGREFAFCPGCGQEVRLPLKEQQ